METVSRVEITPDPKWYGRAWMDGGQLTEHHISPGAGVRDIRIDRVQFDRCDIADLATIQAEFFFCKFVGCDLSMFDSDQAVFIDCLFDGCKPPTRKCRIQNTTILNEPPAATP